MDISRNFVLDETNLFVIFTYDFAVFKEATRKKWGFPSIDEALKTRARVIYNKTVDSREQQQKACRVSHSLCQFNIYNFYL